jgi:hypothetical protein
VGVKEPGLVLFDGGVGVPELDFPGFGGLHLGASEGDSGLVAIQEKIIMSCLSIVGQGLECFVSRGQLFFSTRPPRDASDILMINQPSPGPLCHSTRLRVRGR